jgi:hypothetical protein
LSAFSFPLSSVTLSSSTSFAAHVEKTGEGEREREKGRGGSPDAWRQKKREKKEKKKKEEKKRFVPKLQCSTRPSEALQRGLHAHALKQGRQGRSHRSHSCSRVVRASTHTRTHTHTETLSLSIPT